MYIADPDGAYAGQGWYRRFSQASGSPSERVISEGDHHFPLLAYATFTPEAAVCEPSVGSSQLYVVDLATGVGSSIAPLQDPIAAGTAGSREVEVSTPLGSGVPSAIRFLQTQDGSPTIVGGTSEGDVYSEKTTDTFEIPLTRFNWREIIQ